MVWKKHTSLILYYSIYLYKMLFTCLHDARKNCHHFGNMYAYIDEFNKSADLSIMIGDLNYHNIGYGRIC